MIGTSRHWLFVCALVLAYSLPGLFGHDPWKPDEPYTFGIAANMLKSGDWVVPVAGGEPFVEKPPLFYWTAAIFMGAIPDALAPYDAARLASLFFLLVSLASIAGAAALARGSTAALPAVALFIATLGLEGAAQRLHVDAALLAGFCIALLGLAACAADRPWGGIVVGVGVGAGFLAKGLLAPVAIAAAAALLPLFPGSWRSRAFARQMIVAALVALPAMLAWPIALHARSITLFDQWFWQNNLGRFVGYSVPQLGAGAEPGQLARTFAWFLFPTWGFAVAAFARDGRDALRDPAVQIGIACASSLAAILALSASLRAVYLLPLIPALVLTGLGPLQAAESVYERLLGAAAVVVAAAIAIGEWGVWEMLLVTERAPGWKWLANQLPEHFAMPFEPFAVTAALALTAAFLALVAGRRKLGPRGIHLWVASLALVWGLGHTLWLPWLDYALGYRGLFADMARHLPRDKGCMVVDGLGESERTMAEHYLGVEPRQRFDREHQCGSFLWMGNAQKLQYTPQETRWRYVWGGSRPGEQVERFQLYVRQ